MTTSILSWLCWIAFVVEAYRLDRYDNIWSLCKVVENQVVEAYRLDRYDNIGISNCSTLIKVVEAYRLDRYDNSPRTTDYSVD